MEQKWKGGSKARCKTGSENGSEPLTRMKPGFDLA